MVTNNSYDKLPYEVSDGDVTVPDMLLDDDISGSVFDDGHYALGRITDYSDKLSSRPSEREKSKIVSQTAGFYPVNTRELSESLSLIDDLGTPRSTIGHLNEILIHQQSSSSTKPASAMRLILSEYIGFAKRARADLTSLLQLKHELDEADVNGRSSIANIANTGLGQYVRSIDLRAYSDQEENSFLSKLYVPPSNNRTFEPYTASDTDKLMMVHITEAISKTRLDDARRNVNLFIEEQKARMRFWVDRISEARAHMAVKTIAEIALKDLGIKD